MPSLDTLSFSGDPNWVFGKEIVVGLLAIGLVVVLIVCHKEHAVTEGTMRLTEET